MCFWRVRHAWHKNLMKRCSEIETRARIAKGLGRAVHKICKGVGNIDTFKDIMEDVDVGDFNFMEYVKAVWFPRLGLWIKALKTLPLASQETSAAMEFYHNQLRLRLINEKDPNVYQRADWLVDKLGTKVHSYFWLDEYSGKDDFARYRRDEWLSGLTAWRKSLKIPDADVAMEGECVKVVDQEHRDTVHVIWNPGSEYAICDCNWANKGNLCEHVIRTIKFCREKGHSMPSVSMFQYNRALADMLHCSPYDSLIRDHAVSLAVWVETLLNSQIGQDNRGFTANPEKEQSANEFCYRNENISSQLENSSTNQHKSCSTNSGRGILSNPIAGESCTCDENRLDKTCVGMQTDPSSILNSISQPSVNGNTITDPLAESRDAVITDVDEDLRKNLYSTNAESIKRSGAEDIFGKSGWETIMDMEMESIDILPLAMTSSDVCTETLQNGVSNNCDGLSPSLPKPVDTQPVNTVVDNTHPPAPGIVDFKVVDIAEASNVIEKTQNGSGREDICLTSSMDSPVDIVN